MRLSQRFLWVTLLLLALLAAALVLIPAVLIRPFSPQTSATMAAAFLLRRWAPLLTPFAAGLAALVVWRIWREGRRALGRVLAAVLALPAFGAVWLARQNHFEWMFAPLPDARFVRAAEATFVTPEDMVLAVAVRGEPVAYPVRQLAYHHLVEDAVGQVPIVATY